MGFSNCQFHGIVDFGDIDFIGRPSFAGSHFHGGATFNGASFANGADFRKTTHHARLSLSLSTFGGDANFYRAKFNRGLDCREATFKSDVGFEETSGQELDLSKSRIHGNVSFSDSEVRKFTLRRFECDGSVFFSGDTAEESKTGGVVLTRGRIGKYITIRNTTFQSKIRVHGEVHGPVDIKNCVFEEGADFRGLELHGGLSIKESVIRQGLTFQETDFRAITRIENVITSGSTVSFFQSRFSDDAFIASEQQRQLAFEECTLDLRDVHITDSGSLRLTNVDLSKAELMNTDVRQIDFVGVRWPQNHVGMVYDEINCQGKLPHSRLEEVYRGLKQNYFDKGDYGRGGDFHFREKEMLRINDDTSAQKRFLLNVYKALSGYGERLWAARSFVVLIFLSAIVSLAIGLESSHIGHAERLVNGQLRLWRLDNLFSSLLYALQLAFLRRPENFSTASHWADFVRFTTMVTGPILIGLFALAVRQKLKR